MRVMMLSPRIRSRLFRTSAAARAKVLCALYPDPTSGFPPKYARDALPTLDAYPDGMTLPTPKGIDFVPGELLGSASGALGLRPFLEREGHQLVVTTDKDGEGCEFERHLPDAEYVISQPFFPAYMSRRRLEMAPKLRACITAGIGSDHVDLQAAMDRRVDVCEVTFCNSISVAEHVVMTILALVRNFVPAHERARDGGWNIADIVQRSYDLEGMHVGTVAAGRIGRAVLERLRPFGVQLHYCDNHALPPDAEAALGARRWEKWTEMAAQCDVVTLNCPLHPATEHMVNTQTIGSFKRGAYLINTARGKLCDRDVIAAALRSGQLGGYAGDVWFPQPPAADHPWRTMPNHAMTPHVSGTSLSAQARYASGVREILECYFEGRPIREPYQIVTNGALAGAGAHAYTAGDSTKGAL